MSIKKAIYYLIVISVCFHVITILYEEIMLQIKIFFIKYFLLSKTALLKKITR